MFGLFMSARGMKMRDRSPRWPGRMRGRDVRRTGHQQRIPAWVRIPLDARRNPWRARAPATERPLMLDSCHGEVPSRVPSLGPWNRPRDAPDSIHMPVVALIYGSSKGRMSMRSRLLCTLLVALLLPLSGCVSEEPSELMGDWYFVEDLVHVV